MGDFSSIGGAINSPYLSGTQALTSTVMDPLAGMFSSAGNMLQRANARAFDPNVPADQTFAPPVDPLSGRIDDAVTGTQAHQGNMITNASMERDPLAGNAKMGQLEMMINSLRRGVR